MTNGPFSIRIFPAEGDPYEVGHLVGDSLTMSTNAPGGFGPMTFDVPKSIAAQDLAPYARVVVADKRNGSTVCEGTLSLPGKAVEPTGHNWQVATVGPAIVLTARHAPYLATDQTLEGWTTKTLNPGSSTADFAPHPDNPDIECLLFSFENGQPVGTSSVAQMEYLGWERSGQFFGGISYTTDAGIVAGGYKNQLITANTAPLAGTLRHSISFDTVIGSYEFSLGPDFVEPAPIQNVRLGIARTGVATNVGQDVWGAARNIEMRARLQDRYGETVPLIYGLAAGNSWTADLLFTDIAQKYAPELDNAASTIATATTPIHQFAFREPVTAVDLFDNLLQIEPGFTYGVWEKEGNGYRFEVKAWTDGSNTSGAALPVARYILDSSDGFTLEGSDVDIVNRVTVQYRSKAGNPLTTVETLDTTDPHNFAALAMLDGKTRDAPAVELGDELADADGAAHIGQQVLQAHNKTQTAGTVTVRRPVFDTVLGAFVQPWEIRAGETATIRELQSDEVLRITATSFSDADMTTTVTVGTPPAKSVEDIINPPGRGRFRR